MILEQLSLTLMLLMGLAGLFFWHSFPRQQFQQLKTNSRYQYQVLATASILAVLFLLRAGILPGLELHFIGLTAVTLSLGWRMACLTGAISLLPLYLTGQLPWPMAGLELLLGIYLPVMFSYLVFILVYHYLPKHLFVYIFAGAFFGGALTFVVRTLAMAAFYRINGDYSWAVLSDNYLVMIPLFLVPEAMLNGMAITLMVIYRPHWVDTFKDTVYLRK